MASSMTSQKAAMAVSTLTRLGAGIAVFIVMARYLGPTQFGQIAVAMAYAGLLNLLADFGLGTYALRLAGAEPERSTEIVRRALLLKALATIGASLVGVILLLIWSPDAITLKVQIMVFFAMTLASFADMAFVVVRSIGRLWVETRNVVWTSLVSLGLVATLAVLTQDVLATSLAFLASRFIYALATAFTLRAWLILPAEPWPTGLAQIRQMARGAMSYAVDGALTNLSNQIDVVMISILMSPAAVGIYQAGARLVQSISPFAVILSTVYLPKLAHAHHAGNQGELKRLALRLNLEFLVLAVLGSLGFLFGGPLWTRYILGPQYEPLNALWPGFAALVGIRFFNASLGVPLVAIGAIKWRVSAQFTFISINILNSTINTIDQNSVLNCAVYASLIVTFIYICAIKFNKISRG